MRFAAGWIGAPLLLLVIGGAGGLSAQDEWDRASREVRRLPPAAFPDLPGDIRAALEERGCRVPQVWHRTEPHNVIRGRFAAPGQEDWAALCSRDESSTLVVFWGGPVRCDAELESTPDRDWLQGVGEGEIGYSRSIAAVGKDFIERMHREFGGPPLPPLTHEGINHAFEEKASSVLYCHEGRWLTLPGIDE